MLVNSLATTRPSFTHLTILPVQDGASPEAIEALPRFKFRRTPTAGSPAATQKMARTGDEVAVVVEKPQEAAQGGVIVPLAPSDTVKERPVSLEDAVGVSAHPCLTASLSHAAWVIAVLDLLSEVLLVSFSTHGFH